MVSAQCDEGRPSCRRCIQRDEVCEGYRDDATLFFRSENEKVARKVISRQISVLDLAPSSRNSSRALRADRAFGDAAVSYTASIVDPSEIPPTVASSLNLPGAYPWLKKVPDTALPSAEEIAVDQFFEKYVMYPCNQGSSPGFLEHLPSLFREVQAEGRLALRWAVRAAAYASLSRDQKTASLGSKALDCYGRSLSALADALKNGSKPPDDYVLMAVVILDIFEVYSNPRDFELRYMLMRSRRSTFATQSQPAPTL